MEITITGKEIHYLTEAQDADKKLVFNTGRLSKKQAQEYLTEKEQVLSVLSKKVMVEIPDHMLEQYIKEIV